MCGIWLFYYHSLNIEDYIFPFILSMPDTPDIQHTPNYYVHTKILYKQYTQISFKIIYIYKLRVFLRSGQKNHVSFFLRIPASRYHFLLSLMFVHLFYYFQPILLYDIPVPYAVHTLTLYKASLLYRSLECRYCY